MDMYEHAYQMDFGAAAAGHRHLRECPLDGVNHRYSALGAAKVSG